MDVKIEIKKEPLDSISEQNSTHDEQASKFHESQNIHLNVQTGIEVDPLDVLEQDLTCDEEVTLFKKSQMVENKQCQRDEASDPEENMKNCGKKFYHESSRKRFTCSECNNKCNRKSSLGTHLYCLMVIRNCSNVQSAIMKVIRK